MSCPDDIELKIIQEEDRPQIREILRKYFFTDEPLTGYTEPQGVASLEEEDFLLDNIKYGSCVMAVHKPSNKIIGACIAGPQDIDEADQLFEAAAVEGNTKWGKFLKLLACIERDAMVGQRYGVERILYIVGICVDRTMRGRNIASRFYDFLRDLGREKGYQLLRADCSSFYSARIKEQQGWDCINTVVYKEYLDENGKPVFDPPPPHV